MIRKIFDAFLGSDAPVTPALPLSPLVEEVSPEYQPLKGTFFRTLEFGQKDESGHLNGKTWMEASYDTATGKWVLWHKAIHQLTDLLTGNVGNVLNGNILFRDTSFIAAFEQMVTFETSQRSLGNAALEIKTASKLGGDYYKQFAWREGLMMSRSGRLYPFNDTNMQAANFFDEVDLKGAAAFLDRLKTEQFIPVPILLPTLDLPALYEENKGRTEQRLNALYARYNQDGNNIDLAIQILGQELPVVVYAFFKRGFNPKIHEENPENHFNLLKAAIKRSDVYAIHLLSEAGLVFHVRSGSDTPVEVAIAERQYSQLNIMLSRDGEKLANYCDADGHSPAVSAINQQDRQAYRMLYLEGIDFNQRDSNGWALIHHAFAKDFMPAIYTWLDEGLSLDTPITGTDFTAVSIAKSLGNSTLMAFAITKGANENVAIYAPKEVSPPPLPTPVSTDFSLDILNTPATNTEIAAKAKVFIEAGGAFSMLTNNGQSLFEICWKNKKSNPDIDRRALINVFAGLGVDPAIRLDDGTTALTRITAASTLDMDFLKALAPLVKDPNTSDEAGNNLLHRLQMNPNDVVSNSNNVLAILKLFPSLDINRQNGDGLSNVALAVRLNRGQTIKVFTTHCPSKISWDGVTNSGWSILDLAFTKAAGLQPVTNCPRADKIMALSDTTRTAVLDLMTRSVASGASLTTVFNQTRPDGRTFSQALTIEPLPESIIDRLLGFGLVRT